MLDRQPQPPLPRPKKTCSTREQLLTDLRDNKDSIWTDLRECDESDE